MTKSSLLLQEMTYIPTTETDIVSPTCYVIVWKIQDYGEPKKYLLPRDHVCVVHIGNNDVTEENGGLEDICEVYG